MSAPIPANAQRPGLGGGGGELPGRLLWGLFRDVLKVLCLCAHSGHKPRLLLCETVIQNESSEVSEVALAHAALLAAARLLFSRSGPLLQPCSSHPQRVPLAPAFPQNL